MRGLLAPFQQLDGPAQERLSVVGRQTMLKDYGHGTPWDLNLHRDRSVSGGNDQRRDSGIGRRHT